MFRFLKKRKVETNHKDPLRSERLDHLAGFETVPPVSRASRRLDTGARVLAAIKEHGADAATAGPALRAAATRHYRSWDGACRAAGIATSENFPSIELLRSGGYPDGFS